MSLFSADMDKPFGRARMLHLSMVFDRFEIARAVVFPDSCDAFARAAIPAWLAKHQWRDDQTLSIDDSKGLMRFALANDRDDLLREFVAREDIVKFWLNIQTLRELYSQISRDSTFGRLLFKERKRQVAKVGAFLDSKKNAEKARQMTALLGVQILLWPATKLEVKTAAVQNVCSVPLISSTVQQFSMQLL